VIGACLTSKKEAAEIKELFGTNSPFEKLLYYILNLFLFTFQSKITLLDPCYMNRTIKLQNKFANFLDLNITNDIKDAMITSAYDTTKSILAYNKSFTD
jgi:hypothetical protein